MPKFFVDKAQIVENHITIIGSDVNHIAKVLRANVGESLTVCDGEGYDYEVRILSIAKEEIVTEVLQSYPCRTEPKTHVTLFQGLPKQGKMEWIIEKCTEMGVSAIVPLQMSRSVVKLSPEQAEKKLERWNKTAEAAAKQCGRGRIPKVYLPMTIDQLQAESLPSFLLLPYEEEKSLTVRQALTDKKADSAGIFIGPEGGFEPFEVEKIKGFGAKSVTLGPRILRTETAGLAALTVLLYEWNEM